MRAAKLNKESLPDALKRRGSCTQPAYQGVLFQIDKFRNYCLLLVVCSLVSACLPKEVRGFYHAGNGDSLWLKRNGEILWSPLSKTRDDFEHLGMLNYDEDDGKVQLVMASAHPYLGTEIEFLEKDLVILIKWKRFDRNKTNDRATKYTKLD